MICEAYPLVDFAALLSKGRKAAEVNYQVTIRSQDLLVIVMANRHTHVVRNHVGPVDIGPFVEF